MVMSSSNYLLEVNWVGGQMQWLTTVIPATWKADTRRIVVKGSFKIPSQPIKS
jgi:hypothetical protein